MLNLAIRSCDLIIKNFDHTMKFIINLYTTSPLDCHHQFEI